MPLKLPLRTRSARVKSPSVSSRGRKDTSSHASSSAGKTGRRPSSTYGEPEGGLLKPSSSTRRSRSHETSHRPPPSSSAYSRRNEHRGPSVPRRSSTRRDSVSPKRHSGTSRPSRSDRHARYSERRRSSSSSLSPFSRHSPSRAGTSHDKAKLDEPSRRGRSSSTAATIPTPPAWTLPPKVELPKPTFAPGGTGRPASHASPHTHPSSGHSPSASKEHRPATPAKYRPHSRKSPSPSGLQRASHSIRDHLQHVSDGESSSPSHSHDNILKNVTGSVATHAAISALSKYASTAKEWAGKLNDMRDAPEEIKSLSERATVARDTIAQIQGSLEARPDLLEDETGRRLKSQIEDAIESTRKTLSRMNKMLADLTTQIGGQEGGWRGGVSDIWNSYKYKTEGEEQVKEADTELQKDLTVLSTLMVNLYSRALMKQAPVQAPAQTPAQTLAEKKGSSKRRESPERRESSNRRESPKKMESLDSLQSPKMGESPEKKTSSDSPPSVVLQPPLPTDSESSLPDTLATETDRTESRTPSPRRPKTVKMSLPVEPTSRNSSPSPNSSQLEPPPKASARIPTPAPVSLSGPTTSPGSSLDATAPATAPPLTPSRVALAEEAIDSTHQPSVSDDKHDPPHASTDSLDYEQNDPEERVLDAAWDGDIDAVAEALRHASTDSRDLRGLTPLHLASEKDHLAVAIMLIDRGADVHARANGGRMPLHLASRFASPDTVEMLLERGRADPNSQTSDGRTPLHYAASAAKEGDEERREVIRVLRDWGAHPLLEDHKKNTPRDVAQKRDYWDAASTLRRAEQKWEDEHHQNWLQRRGLMK